MGKTEYHLKNSTDLRDKVKELKLEKDKCMISHDVTSLFTKVPMDDALRVIRSRLENDDNLKDRTNLNVDDIMELMTIICDRTYFSFQGQLYEQCFGTPMGSPLSSIIVNL